jgi:hypothetical protein
LLEISQLSTRVNIPSASVHAEHPSVDGGDTVVMSRNVPIGDDKPAPAILKAQDTAKEIEIENEDDWAVPADEEPMDVDTIAPAPADPDWEAAARAAAEQQERERLERDKREEQVRSLVTVHASIQCGHEA